MKAHSTKISYLKFVKVVVSLGLLIGVSVHTAPAVSAAPRLQQTPTFYPDPCVVPIPLGLEEGRDIVCGYVLVPEQHAAPSGPTIRLEVAILKSEAASPAPDPLVILQGGPGGSTLEDLLTPFARSPLRANRDLVLFDQRGALHSEPGLRCPELLELTEQTIEQHLSPAEADRRSLEASLACRRRLVAEGVDLGVFDSFENAADIEWLRQALGYGPINLYGVSYGSQLAQHFMRVFPASLRAVVLDAVVPTQGSWLAEYPRAQDRAFRELFRACAADQDCDAAYPNLEQVFFELVDRFNQTPARIPITDSETGRRYNATVDGNTLMDILFQFLYVSDLIPALPKMIYDLRAGDSGLITAVWPLLVFDRHFSSGMYDSVVCAEEMDYQPDELPAGLYPQLAAYARRSLELLQALCQQWQVPPLGAEANQAVVSDVPTLVLNGQFDPITPPDNGEAVARNLSHSHVVTFPTTGHGAALSGDCPTEIIGAFLDNPNAAPDTACLAEHPRVNFITPRTTLFTNTPIRLLTTPNVWDAVRGLIVALAALVLASPFLIWPLVLLIRLFRRRRVETAGGWGWLARAVALGVSALALVFLAGLVGVLGYLAFSNNVILFYGLPRQAAPLFIVPWVVVLLAALMLVVGMVVLRPGWPMWERAYFTLLAMTALGYMAVLAQWGFVWVWG
jgi:pimeloyl-ACP methyl ester carboxylesterase